MRAWTEVVMLGKKKQKTLSYHVDNMTSYQKNLVGDDRSCTEATVDDCSKEERKRKEPRAMNKPTLLMRSSSGPFWFFALPQSLVPLHTFILLSERRGTEKTPLGLLLKSHGSFLKGNLSSRRGGNQTQKKPVARRWRWGGLTQKVAEMGRREITWRVKDAVGSRAMLFPR